MAAAEQPDSGTGNKKSGGIVKMLIWLIVVTVSIGGGFAAPLLIAKLTAPPVVEKKPEPTEVMDLNEEVEFIDFEEVVAVLGKSRFSRYLKVSLSLQVAKSQRLEVETKITARTAVLRNRIIAHIAETSEEDLGGQHGQNQFRRKMHGFFNEILFEDGIEPIQDVLFREFQVQ